MACLLPSARRFAWVAVLMLSAIANGAIQQVQHAFSAAGQSCGAAYAGSAGPYSVVFPSANTAGNAIVVYAFWAWGGTQTARVSDSLGNSYTSVPIAVSTTSPTAQQSVGQVFYASNIRGGVNAVTLTLDPCYDWPAGLAILEYSGFPSGVVLDTSASQVSPPSTNSASTPSVTTTVPNELLIGAFTDVAGTGTIAPGAGWTSEVSVPCFYSMVEDQIVASTGTYTATATLPTTDNRWIGTIAAFLTAPNDAGPPSVPDGGRDSGFLVQTNENYQLSAASITLPFGAPTTAGNHIVVLGYWGKQTGGANAAVFDSQGDEFKSLQVTVNAAAASTVQVFYAEGIDGGRDTVTLVQPGDGGRAGVAIFEYAGLISSNALDGHEGQAAPDSGAFASTPSVGTAEPDELLFSGFIHPDPSGPYAGAGLIVPGAGWSPISCSVSSYLLVEERTVSSLGQYSATAQMPVADSDWTAVLATFRIAQPDGGAPDAGDGGSVDAGSVDGGAADGGAADASVADAGPRSPIHDGVGCDCGHASAFQGSALCLLALLLLARRLHIQK